MKTKSSAAQYKGFRFPPEMISHCVWLYFRFSLSFRDVEVLMAQRGVSVTYETVRQWCLKFGQPYANELRHRSPRCGDKWHIDEVVLTIRGKNTTCGERSIRMEMSSILHVNNTLSTHQLTVPSDAPRGVMAGWLEEIFERTAKNM